MDTHTHTHTHIQLTTEECDGCIEGGVSGAKRLVLDEHRVEDGVDGFLVTVPAYSDCGRGLKHNCSSKHENIVRYLIQTYLIPLMLSRKIMTQTKRNSHITKR